jgi:pimeloyl-ACP methyl ester carboxylesterase
MRTATISAPDGVEIAFDVEGEGRALVLVHGLTESRRAWDPLMPALATRWQVVRVDVRGHGASTRRAPYDPLTLAADLRAVVDAVGLDAPLVVGHSMGGVVVTTYGALGHPARGVVDVDQTLELSGFQEQVEGIRPMLEGDDASFRAAMDLVFGALYPPLPDDERARLRSIASPEQEVVLGVWDAVLNQPLPEVTALVEALLRELRAPFLSLHGSDPGAGYVEWLRGVVGHACVEVWSDHGHYPHLVDPGRFVARLEQLDREL